MATQHDNSPQKPMDVMDDHRHYGCSLPGRSRSDRHARCQLADAQYEEAKILCKSAGMKLIRHRSSHYTLIGPKRSSGEWALILFPDTLRMMKHTVYAKPPFLNVGKDWTLLAVVGAALSSLERKDYD